MLRRWELNCEMCPSYSRALSPTGEDKATIPVTDTEFSQTGNPQSFCTGVSVHHQALIQNTGPLIDMSDIRPGTSEYRSWHLRDISWAGHIIFPKLRQDHSAHLVASDLLFMRRN